MPDVPVPYNPEDHKNSELILRYLLGGTLLGGGAALGTGLARRISKEKEDQEYDEAAADNSVRVPVAKAAGAVEPEVETPSNFAPAIGIAGGVLGAGGAYALVNSFLRAQERARLKEQLEEAQQAHLQSLGEERAVSEKAASAIGHASDYGLALPLLLAAASGGLGYMALDKYFPRGKVTRDVNRVRPRRVELVEGGEEAPEKVASELTPEETEHLIRTASCLMDVGLDDVVKVAAHGKVHGIRKAAAAGQLFEYCEKLASTLAEPEEHMKVAALTWLSTEDLTAETMKVVSASVIREASPMFFAMGKEASENDALRTLVYINIAAQRQQHAEKLAAVWGPAVKKAQTGVDMGAMLGDALAQDKDDHAQVDSTSAAGLSDEEGEESDQTNETADGPIPQPVQTNQNQIPQGI